jgi:hypothetical protein
VFFSRLLGQTANYYRMAGLPTNLFIGADGKLRSFHTGELSPEGLEDNIARLKAD